MQPQNNVRNTDERTRFELGSTVATADVLRRIELDDIQFAILRHSLGDWGDVCMQDKKANDLALENGGRLFSRYRDQRCQKFWVITEADRGTTTVLFPEEY